MASTLDSRLFNGICDTHLSPLDQPSPIRITPISHGLSRDAWGHKNSIWQTAPRVFEYISNDEKKSVPSTRNNKVPVADMSKTVAGASTTGDHNIGTSNGAYIAPSSSSSATLSSRLMGGLISPTRLRSNGGSGTDTGNTMPGLGRLSLLPGSAPDIESFNFSSSSSAFDKRQRPSVGRDFRHFNVEEAEEFVPSYLQDSSRYSSHTDRLGANEVPVFHNSSAGTGKPEFGDDLDTSGIQQWDRMCSAESQFRKWNGAVKAGVALEEPAGHHSYHPAFGAGRGTAVQLGMSGPHDMHPTVQYETGLTYGTDRSTDREASNLRPDVSSYRPTNYNRSLNSHLTQPKMVGFTYGAGRTHQMEPGNIHVRAMNQHTAFANSGAFYVNGSTEDAAYATGIGVRKHHLPPHNITRYDMNDLRNRSFGGDMAYRDPEYATPVRSRSGFPGENAAMPYYASPTADPYNNADYEYASETSSMMPYQQQCGVNPVSGALNYFPERSCPQEPERNAAPRSEVLEEFRAYHKSKKYELKDIYGYIVEFSGDQTGSRFIQTKLEQANSDEKQQIFSELQTDVRQLMTDVFGNYVIQKMFEYGNQSQKKTLASYMEGNVLKLSSQTYGCRCVQKAFEHILTDQQAALIKELDGHVITVVESQHGNHVIQKAIECIPEEHIQFIVDAHKNQVVRLARHIYGCRIIQRMLEYCKAPARRAVLNELHCAIPSLIDDQYGNYVIQCIIKKCSPADRYRVIGFVQQELLYYSKHKFASNVVEKAIQFAEDGQRAEMVRTLTKPDPSNGMQSPVLSLLNDQYGNYVIQTVLKTIQGPARKELAEEVRHYLNFIGKNNRAKQITAMADTLAAITVGHSPSSISTGPQTPRTPTSLNSGGNAGTPMTKPIDIAQPSYSTHEAQRNLYSLSQLHA